MIFNVVFFVTIVSLLVQGTTVSAMARWLGLIGKSEEKEIFNVALPDEIKSAMSEIELTEETLAGGNKLLNLSLPDNTLVVMVKRGTQYFVPKGHTQLEPGDRLLVILGQRRGAAPQLREPGHQPLYHAQEPINAAACLEDNRDRINDRLRPGEIPPEAEPAAFERLTMTDFVRFAIGCLRPTTLVRW